MKKRILVVEDHDMNRDMITRRLSRLGYDTVTAVDGLQAIEVAGQNEPDLILMDLGLPRMDGFETTRAIRSRERNGEHVPIIALTAQVEEFDRASALDAGCDEYEPKPIDMGSLVQKIESLIAPDDGTSPTR